MKNDLKILAQTLEKKLGKVYVEHTMHKVWDIMKGKEKPTEKTLNRLALLAGFQSWADFQGALHGIDDGLVNYSTGEQ